MGFRAYRVRDFGHLLHEGAGVALCGITWYLKHGVQGKGHREIHRVKTKHYVCKV